MLTFLFVIFFMHVSREKPEALNLPISLSGQERLTFSIYTSQCTNCIFFQPASRPFINLKWNLGYLNNLGNKIT